MTRPPFSVWGSKLSMANWILARMPERRGVFVEVFGGSGAVVLALDPPSPIEVYNDIDSGVVNFYRVLRDSPDDLYRRLALTPYSREEFLADREDWRDTDDPIERARRWFVVVRQAISGNWVSGWASSKDQVRPRAGRLSASVRQWRPENYGPGMSKQVRAYLGAVDRLPEVHARLRRILIESMDFAALIAKYDSPETVFYCDPPYMAETRPGGGEYAHEMTDARHLELLTLLGNCAGAVGLSGYASPLYDATLSGWARHVYRRRQHAPGARQTNTRDDTLWVREAVTYARN